MMKSLLLVTVAVVVSCSGPLYAAEVVGTRLPTVIVLRTDDLGYNDTGCYGAKPEHLRTPHIDRLASQGTRFTDGHAASSVCHAPLDGIKCEAMAASVLLN